MPCEVTIYWRRSKSNCPHPAVVECSACRIGLCSAHIVECEVCEQALCGDCIIEHRSAHDCHDVTTHHGHPVSFRRRPIPRSPYRWQPQPKGPSLKYDLLLDGAVRKYPDGREVCQDSPAGRREYLRRLELMCSRQSWMCSHCEKRMRSLFDATFDHEPKRKMGSSFRNDRIYNEDGSWRNSAMHWVCNSERG